MKCLFLPDHIIFDVPFPEDKKVEVEEGGVDEALRKMLEILRELPENENLQEYVEPVSG